MNSSLLLTLVACAFGITHTQMVLQFWYYITDSSKVIKRADLNSKIKFSGLERQYEELSCVWLTHAEYGPHN